MPATEKPTAHLRFVLRRDGDSQSGERKILQQLWEVDTINEKGAITFKNPEWRDVPLDQSSESLDFMPAVMRFK